MATIKRFEDIKAWQKARLYCKQIFSITSRPCFTSDFALRNQINRSSGSIMDNIAEGFGRGGNNEFVHFLEISRASACESQSQLYRAFDRNYITRETHVELHQLAELVKAMLLGLIIYLNKSSLSGPKYLHRKTSKTKSGKDIPDQGTT